jgi:ubiquinol-cytochrome c reductase subunit 7
MPNLCYPVKYFQKRKIWFVRGENLSHQLIIKDQTMAGMLRNIMVGLESSWGARYRAACGHRQYGRLYNADVSGLLYDDLRIETPIVTEAVRRLPQDVQDARDRRIQKAFDLSVKKTVLPESEWVLDDQDIPYLAPYLEEVEREFAERQEFFQH